MNKKITITLICLGVLTVAFGVTTAAPPGGGPPPHANPNNGDTPLHDDDLNHTYPDYFNNVNRSNLGELTPLEKRLWAMFKIENLEVNHPPQIKARHDAVTLLNKSAFTHHIKDPRRVKSVSAFDDAHNALRRINRLEDTETVELSSLAVYEASRGTAELSVKEASKVLENNREAFNNVGRLNRAEQQLKNAHKALQRAKQKANNEKPPIAIARANAVKDFGKAWKHAEKVLEAIESQTSPEVEITSSSDAYELQENHIEYPLSVVVNDIRPYELDAAIVKVNGEKYGEFKLDSSTEPGRSATFETSLELTAKDNVIKVVVTRSDKAGSDSVSFEAPGFADETYTITVEDNETGVSLNLTGKGLREKNVDIDDTSPDERRDFEAGPQVHIEVLQEFDNATVEVPLFNSVNPASDDRNLSIYKWDQHANQSWHPIETEIDTQEGVARAKVNSFSYFSVFWVENWNNRMSKTVTLDEDDIINETDPSFEPLDLMLVLDESGSMRGSRLANTKKAAKRFVGALLDEDRAGLIGYASGASIKQHLTNDKQSLNKSIDSLSAGGSTNTGAGLQVAIHELSVNGTSDIQQIILLSDGQTNAGPNPVVVAQDAAQKGIVVNTIGVGPSINPQLRQIANVTGGDFHHVQSSEDLPEIFGRVAERDVQLVDTDGDGIPDVAENMDLGMPKGSGEMAGQLLNLDPTKQDTSGDGIPDNEAVEMELAVFEEGDKQKATARVVDTSVHPSTGEEILNKRVEIGVVIPTYADPETKEPLTNYLNDLAHQPEGYGLAYSDYIVPSTKSCGILCTISFGHLDNPYPNWLPVHERSSEEYFVMIEPSVYVIKSHDVEDSDLPEQYTLKFEGDNHRGVEFYDNSGTLPTEKGFDQTKMVIKTISGSEATLNPIGVGVPWLSIGNLRMEFEVPKDSDFYVSQKDSGGTVLTSDKRYFYNERWGEISMDIARDSVRKVRSGASASNFIGVGSIAIRVMTKSGSSLAGGALVAVSNAHRVTNVVDGDEPTGEAMYQTDIYDDFDEDDVITIKPTRDEKRVVIVGNGPFEVRDANNID